MRKETDTFLRQYGMHYDTIDMRKETDAFLKQMRDGLAGRPSSLMMIPTFITVTGGIPSGREVIVMDAGGTNLRVATVRLEADGRVTVANFSKQPMPGTQGRLTKDEFFEKFADYMEPVLKNSDAQTVGFCFSFATEILPSKEGRIKVFSKEIRVDGAEGQLVGESLNAVLKKRGYAPKRFILLNDTVATMLGGMAGGTGAYSSFIGYILGTGTNICYLEQCANITKMPEAAGLGGQMAINCESGNYDGFAQGKFDQEVDAESKAPGGYRMEKMISGAYQGTVIYKTVRGAVADGLFSAAFAERFGRMERFTMPQIDAFCADPQNGGELAALADNGQDRETLYDIIDTCFERSARMTAGVFAAIIRQSGAGTDRTLPVCITAEGTSFTKSVLFKKKLDIYIQSCLNDTLGLWCDIIGGNDVNLTGSAIAALVD